MPFCVGLTGGIGSGKSKVAGMFAELGAAVVDTDAISHELTAVAGRALPAIASRFGARYLKPDGSLDRALMRELVFADLHAKRQLEEILHPLIGTEARARIRGGSGPYVILVVPLLLETGAYRDVLSRVLVVDCEEAQQIERTMARSRLTADEVRAIMAAQLPRGDRLMRADDVIVNDADINTLKTRVQALHRQYVAAAGAAP